VPLAKSSIESKLSPMFFKLISLPLWILFIRRCLGTCAINRRFGLRGQIYYFHDKNRRSSMEINFHQLQMFVAVAREKSFSRAARKLRISQPSVSIQIRKLEESFDVKLFERVSHTIRLTAEGALVLEHANKMFSAVDDLESAIQNLKKTQCGPIKVGCSRVPSARLVPIAVAVFKRKYPDTEISIKTGRSHEVELGIIEGDPTDESIAKEPAYADELLLVLPPQSRLFRRQQWRLKDVVEEPFLLQAPGVRPPFIERMFAAMHMVIKKPIIVGSREAVKAAIAAGCGLSLLPRSVVENEISTGVLEAKKVADLYIRYPMSIIYRRDKNLSKSAQIFLHVLRKQGRELVRRQTDRRRHVRTLA